MEVALLCALTLAICISASVVVTDLAMCGVEKSPGSQQCPPHYTDLCIVSPGTTGNVVKPKHACRC